jgi:invasion protein IalB
MQLRLLPGIALLALATAFPAAAQEGDAPAETPTAPPAEASEGGAPAPETGGFSMGEPVPEAGSGIGEPYVKEEHGDWLLRCIRTPSGLDPCQLYQLLKDAEGNSVAEFAIFPLLPPQGEAVAGGSIITPLETLLTQGVTFAIDGGEARIFPFTFCAQMGCVARVGYAEADIAAFKAGSAARIAVVPVVAPDQRIELTLSLRGFTAGYDALAAVMQEIAARAAEAGAEAPAPEGETPAPAPEGGEAPAP